MKKIITILTIALAVSLNAKTIELKYPAPQLIGTPVPMNSANLDTSEPVTSFEAPEGVSNIALGKTVTSSDDMPIIGDLELINDGNKDAQEGYFVELMDDVQWVQIDLAKQSEVYAVALWHYHSQVRAYNDVVVQLSDDEKFVSGVTTIFNNDIDNSAGLGKGTDKLWKETNKGKLIVLEKPIKAKYIRLYSNGSTSNTANHYIEVEVYAK